MIHQLDLFKDAEESRLDCLEFNIEETRKSLHKVRRGTYARLNELESLVRDVCDRQKIIERNICKNL